MKIVSTARRLLGRLPRVGDAVWWAPKQEELKIVIVQVRGFVCVGGPAVSKGEKTTPRWTLRVPYESAIWDESVHAWIVGQGPAPKAVRGMVISPEPAVLRVRP